MISLFDSRYMVNLLHIDYTQLLPSPMVSAQYNVNLAQAKIVTIFVIMYLCYNLNCYNFTMKLSHL